MKIHPTALVADTANLGADVSVGAYAVIGEHVVLGDRTVVHSHAIVSNGRLGDDCIVHPFAVVGGDPQTRGRSPAPPSPGVSRSTLLVGVRCEFREHVTVHGGTAGGVTEIGDDALVMAGAHVAHDCVLGNGVTLANAVQLAGHVRVGNFVTFGGLAAVGQRLSIGDYAFVAGGALCEQNVPPYVIVQGDRARVRAVNRVGLIRHGFPPELIARLDKVVRAALRKDLPRVTALSVFADAPEPEVRALADALR